MRDFQQPGRSPVYAFNGMAATSHPAATLTALDVLRSGGNAIDAAVAACATLCVVEPMSTGIGGDCFVLYAPRGGAEVIAFNGSGRAPAAANVEWFLDQGIDEIPPGGPHAVTVPGAVDAWARLVSDHGRKGLDELLQPAIALADDGYVVHPRIAASWHGATEKLRRDGTAARIFLPGGRAPRAGEVHRQPELGDTLRAIADQGRDGFYGGRVAEDIVSYLRSLGGVHTLDDFAAAEGAYVTPISTNYRGYDIYECPPNAQGLVVLIMLNILAGCALPSLEPLGIERLHFEIEAGRLAMSDRDRHIADPASADVPVETLLSEAHAAELRARISPDRAITDLPPPAFPAHPDTVYLSVVDRDRNAVSFINSLFHGFGGGLVSPGAGVVLQNRGAGFIVKPGHPNCIASGKRPLHTIIPGMALKDGRTIMPFGVMGGQYQPFGHAHVLGNVIDHGMDVQAALDLARVFAYGNLCEVERGVGDDVARGLAALGHRVERAASPLGGGQAIGIDWDRGVLVGGSDPRKDGCALGY